MHHKHHATWAYALCLHKHVHHINFWKALHRSGTKQCHLRCNLNNMWARSFGRSYTNLSLHTFRLHPRVNLVQKLSITCHLWLLLWDNFEPLVVMLFAQYSHRVAASEYFLKVLEDHFPISLSCPWDFKSRDEILLKGGRLWRPRFLIIVISANGRVSRVKPADSGQT
jgi:hypothetical protein